VVRAVVVEVAVAAAPVLQPKALAVAVVGLVLQPKAAAPGALAGSGPPEGLGFLVPAALPVRAAQGGLAPPWRSARAAA
jgi:hypothetical protein